MKKNTKLHIPISTEDKETIKERAKACGHTLSQYCLMVLLHARPKILIEEIPE